VELGSIICFACGRKVQARGGGQESRSGIRGSGAETRVGEEKCRVKQASVGWGGGGEWEWTGR